MSSSALSRDFTQGNIPKQLIRFTLPFMASNAMQVLYSAIDMMIVGKYVGPDGLAAVSQSSQILSFVTMLCLGFSNAGQVLISQALGAGKKKELSRIMGTLFILILLLGGVLSLLILSFMNPIMKVMNIPQESWDMAVQYLFICGAGLIFTAGYNMVSAVLRGMGDSKRPFLFIAIASAVNLILDILFTGMLGWGVAGAAAATILGQAISFLFSIIYLYKHREGFGFDFSRESFKIESRYAKLIGSLGTPMAIQSGFINLSLLFVNALVNDLGYIASATFGVGMRIDDLCNKVSQGLQFAASPMIGQNIAAGQKERAKKVVWYTWLYSFAFTALFLVAYLGFGRQLFSLFTDDAGVLELSGTFIAAIIWMFPAFAIMRGTGGFITGIGNARLGMVLALLDGVILRIGLSYLFGIVLGMGFFGFVLGYGLAPYGYAIPSLIYFLSGIWRRRRTLAEKM